MMKKLFLQSLVMTTTTLFISCDAVSPTKNNNIIVVKDSTPLVGNDSDEHGCKGSAGYQWSPLKNNCIRLFEEGIRLDAKAKDLDTAISAFIVFGADNREDSVELHLPSQKNSVFLFKDKTNGAGKWTNDLYELSQWKGMYTLEDKKKKVVLYQGSALK